MPPGLMPPSSPPAGRRRIYLMRHAEVAYFDAEGRPLDPRQVPLTSAGRHQARAAAELLAAVDFDLAVCSGLPRTRETAAIVLGGRALILEEDARLKEVKAGRLAEVPAVRREPEIAYAYDQAPRPGARFIGGEPWTDFEARVLAAWHGLLDRVWHDLLLVAHDAVNRVLLSRIAGAGLAGLQAFEQDPACINLIDIDIADGVPRRAFLRAVNLAPYDLLRRDDRLTVMEKIYRAYGAQAPLPHSPAPSSES